MDNKSIGKKAYFQYANNLPPSLATINFQNSEEAVRAFAEAHCEASRNDNKQNIMLVVEMAKAISQYLEKSSEWCRFPTWLVGDIRDWQFHSDPRASLYAQILNNECKTQTFYEGEGFRLIEVNCKYGFQPVIIDLHGQIIEKNKFLAAIRLQELVDGISTSKINKFCRAGFTDGSWNDFFGEESQHQTILLNSDPVRDSKHRPSHTLHWVCEKLSLKGDSYAILTMGIACDFWCRAI